MNNFQDNPFENYKASQNLELGRKTHFWYRVYCGVLFFLYLLCIGLGLFFIIAQPNTREYNANEVYIMGFVYLIIGVIFAIISGIALILPAKPYNWIVGIVMLALGMTSCCFIPIVIPIFIYWIKPETQAYFGRKT